MSGAWFCSDSGRPLLNGRCASEALANQRHRFFRRCDSAVELRVFRGLQHVFELRAGRVAGGDELAAGEEWFGTHIVLRHRFVPLADEVVDFEIGVRGQTVHFVERKMLFEAVETEKALEGRLSHARASAKRMWFSIERENLARIVVGEAEAAADFGSHGYADFDVAVEADAVGCDAKCGRLADVVQQRAPGQRAGAGPRVARAASACGRIHRLRDETAEAAARPSSWRSQATPLRAGRSRRAVRKRARAALGEHLGQLVANTLAADRVNPRGESADGRIRGRLECVAESRGETHRAEQAELVLFKAAARFADGADDPGIEIGEAAK